MSNVEVTRRLPSDPPDVSNLSSPEPSASLPRRPDPVANAGRGAAHDDFNDAPQRPRTLQRTARSATAATIQDNAPERLARARTAITSEIRGAEEATLARFDVELQIARSRQATALSSAAGVELTSPGGVRLTVSADDLPGLAAHVEHQSSRLALGAALRTATMTECAALSATLQRAQQDRGCADSVAVNLPSGRVITMSAGDLAAAAQLVEARYVMLQQTECADREAGSAIFAEVIRAGVLSMPIAGAVIGLAEVARGRTLTGNELSRTESVFIVLGAAVEFAAAGVSAVRLASRIQLAGRIQEVGLATRNPSMTIGEGFAATRGISEADRSAIITLSQRIRSAERVQPGRVAARGVLNDREMARAVDTMRRLGVRAEGEGALQIGALFAEEGATGGRALTAEQDAVVAAARGTEAPTARSAWFRRREPVLWDATLRPGNGETSAGQSLVSPLGSNADRMAVLFHESVHRALSPRFEVLLRQRSALRGAAYEHSHLLRFLEESLAESYATLRTTGFRKLPDAMTFPLRGNYGLRLSRVYGEGAIGTVSVGSVTYAVYETRGPIDGDEDSTSQSRAVRPNDQR